jgi:hypothetical protein
MTLIKKSRNNTQGNIIRKKTKRKLSAYKIIGVITLIIILAYCLSDLYGSTTKKITSLISAYEAKYQNRKDYSNLADLSRTDTINLNDKEYTQDELVSRVSRIMSLPGEKVNMMVKIKNADSLRSQSDLYAKVKNNDYMLIYTHTAIVYDPTVNSVTSVISLK